MNNGLKKVYPTSIFDIDINFDVFRTPARLLHEERVNDDCLLRRFHSTGRYFYASGGEGSRGVAFCSALDDPRGQTLELCTPQRSVLFGEFSSDGRGVALLVSCLRWLVNAGDC